MCVCVCVCVRPGTEAGEFFSAVERVWLKPGQVDTLDVSFLPLNPGTKHCSLLLLCPQVSTAGPKLT